MYSKKDKSSNKKLFQNSLKEILDLTETIAEIKIEQIFYILSGKGSAALLIIFSFPFCLPIQIPGFSTPFGIMLGYLGLRIAFGQKVWWPKWILSKSIASKNLNKIVKKIITFFQYRFVKKLFKPRLTFFTQNSLHHRILGIVIFLLAILLALPLPIPMTNMLAAMPILSMGLGLLEDDGLFIIIGYILALICFISYLGLFLLGKFFFL